MYRSPQIVLKTLCAFYHDCFIPLSTLTTLQLPSLGQDSFRNHLFLSLFLRHYSQCSSECFVYAQTRVRILQICAKVVFRMFFIFLQNVLSNQHCLALHSIAQPCLALLSITQHCLALLSIAQYCSALLSIAQHYSALLSIACHQHHLALGLLVISIAWQYCIAPLSIPIAQYQHCLVLALLIISIALH